MLALIEETEFLGGDCGVSLCWPVRFGFPQARLGAVFADKAGILVSFQHHPLRGFS